MKTMFTEVKYEIRRMRMNSHCRKAQKHAMKAMEHEIKAKELRTEIMKEFDMDMVFKGA